MVQGCDMGTWQSEAADASGWQQMASFLMYLSQHAIVRRTKPLVVVGQSVASIFFAFGGAPSEPTE